MKGEKGWLVATELEMLASPATVQALTRALHHEHPNVRTGAVCSLYAIAWGPRGRNNPEIAEPLRDAIPVLANILKTEQGPETTRMATLFLHEFGPSLSPAFSFSKTVLECGNRHLLACAASKHPECFRADEVLPGLVACLKDDDPVVRLEGAEALSTIQPDHPDIVPAFVDHVIHRDACYAVGFSNLDRFIEKALPPLRDAIRVAGPNRRVSILHALAWSHSEVVVPTIVEMLHDDDREVRRQAISSLCCCRKSSALPLMLAGIQDRDPYVRENARRYFRNQRLLAISALPEFIRLLGGDDAYGRVSAALAIRELGEDARTALPAVRRNLGHDDPYVRLGAAITVANFESNGQDLLHILATGIQHPEDDVREFAIEEIWRIGSAAKAVLPPIIEGIKYGWTHEKRTWILGNLLRILGNLGPDAALAIPLLVGSLRHRKSWYARDVLETLGKIGLPAIGPLLSVAHSDNALARRRAVEALGLIGPPAKTLVPMFIGLLENSPPAVRITAAQALGRVGPGAAEAIPILKGLLEDRDLLLRKRAKEALGRIDDRSIKEDRCKS